MFGLLNNAFSIFSSISSYKERRRKAKLARQQTIAQYEQQRAIAVQSAEELRAQEMNNALEYMQTLTASVGDAAVSRAEGGIGNATAQRISSDLSLQLGLGQARRGNAINRQQAALNQQDDFAYRMSQLQMEGISDPSVIDLALDIAQPSLNIVNGISKVFSSDKSSQVQPVPIQRSRYGTAQSRLWQDYTQNRDLYRRQRYATIQSLKQRGQS